MKYLFILPLLLFTITSYGQFNHFVSLRTTINFAVGQKELANAADDAGYGLSVDVSFFSKHKLQALFMADVNSFFGNKVYYLQNEGRQNKNADIYSIRIGPQYFISKRIAFSATAGPAWHAIETVGFSRNMAYQLMGTGFWGKRKKLVTQLFFTEIPKPVANIQYIGLGLGYRIF